MRNAGAPYGSEEFNRAAHAAAEAAMGCSIPYTTPSRDDINVLCLVKGGERYIFLIDDEHRAEAIITVWEFVFNAELSLTEYDASVLTEGIEAK